MKLKSDDLVTLRVPKPDHGPQYWRSLEEKNNPELLRHAVEREFPLGAADPPDEMSRREFMTLIGASAALATAASGCWREPNLPIIPYSNKPEDVTPGTPLHYATAMALDGFGTGLLATAWEGRPTKIEGNPDHPASLGSAGLFEQASVLQLYDPQRARALRQGQSPRSWGEFLRAMADLLPNFKKDGGAGLRFLVEPEASAVINSLRTRILKEYPNARFVSYGPAVGDGAYAGATTAFGKAMDVRYDLTKADTVLSLEADFLSSFPTHLAGMRQFADRRVPTGDMNRLYVVESALSLTGTMADHRLRVRSSELLGFARALAGELAKTSAPGAAQLAKLGAGGETFKKYDAKFLRAVAAELASHPGRCVVMAGDRQPGPVHALVHAINDALGNTGKTVSYSAALLQDTTNGVSSLGPLIEEMKEGKVNTLVVTAYNPAYTAPADSGFATQLARVPNVIYSALYEDETAPSATWFVPRAHYLESWSDVRAIDGTVAIAQPLLEPLFGGHSVGELLAAFLLEGSEGSHGVVKGYWRDSYKGVAFEQHWKEMLHKGVVAGTATATESVTLRWADVAKELSAAPTTTSTDGLELNLMPDLKVYDGRFGNCAWLQELPDPLTKMVWNSTAKVSPTTAARLDLHSNDVVELGYGGQKVRATVLVMPGDADETVTLTLGFGRSGNEAVARGVGTNAYRLRTMAAPWYGGGLTLAKTGEIDRLVTPQTHWTIEDRKPVLVTDLEEYKRDPHFTDELRGNPPSLYRDMPYNGYKWAMSVDLARCTGCSACMMACQTENNIPVTGKQQVSRGRDMQWLRVDRYFFGTAEEPSVVTQPMMCVMCEDAPCEYVCPVNATVHSDEGLNEQVYNRCVGTRYCSNNCPYKVRRFNFLQYNGDISPTQMMQKNPDVTVRGRGVMEKCTYCVQRIERARISTRIEGRTIEDGDLQTACQQACPTDAIVFGSLHNKETKVSKLHEDPRSYRVLNDLGTRPRTMHMARIKNPNPELA